MRKRVTLLLHNSIIIVEARNFPKREKDVCTVRMDGERDARWMDGGGSCLISTDLSIGQDQGRDKARSPVQMGMGWMVAKWANYREHANFIRTQVQEQQSRACHLIARSYGIHV